MFTKSHISVLALFAVTGLVTSIAWATINVPTVPVGLPGNAADSFTSFGAVPYTYSIGTYEVTNAEYAAFLNAVARTDSNNLYNTDMGVLGGITRSGNSGSYTYATIEFRQNHPVNFVSFWDAARFSNWLHNGQPTGAQDNTTTEDGAYTLTPATISSNTVTRNSGAQWALPTEDEWYKAAYYQPQIGPDGVSGAPFDYWSYPTATDWINFTMANYDGTGGVDVVGGRNVRSYFGTYDMAGNVWEWNEARVTETRRGIRGGSYYSPESDLRRDARGSIAPASDSIGWGFRVVNIPGPASAALLALGVLPIRRRR